jgi:ribosomal protein S18 acetylase RimI-like enzyme
MSSPLQIARAEHWLHAVATAIHQVQMLAYAQEAELLGAIDFPPLRRTVEDILTCQQQFYVAKSGGKLVGSISVEELPAMKGKNIASLVVVPEFQRSGIGRCLLAKVLRLYGSSTLTVQTGARNHPALSLYRQLGFEELSRSLVLEETLEIVKLRRAPSQFFGECRDCCI